MGSLPLIDDSDRNQNNVLGFPGKSYIRFICLFVSKCLQFYFYSGQTDRRTNFEFYIYRFIAGFAGVARQRPSISNVQV